MAVGPNRNSRGRPDRSYNGQLAGAGKRSSERQGSLHDLVLRLPPPRWCI